MAEEVDYDEDEYNLEENKKQSRVVTVKTKGRGHNRNGDDTADTNESRGGVYDRLDRGSGRGPLQSIEGWIIIATNVHQEANEDDLLDKFSECGTVKNIHVNLDRRTGYVKGYALIEFDEREDAQNAIKTLNNTDMLGQTIAVDWAFVRK